MAGSSQTLAVRAGGIDLNVQVAGDGPVVVLTGDTPLLTGRTLVTLLLEHESTSASATVLTARLSDPTGYGRVVREADGSVAASFFRLFKLLFVFAFPCCDSAAVRSAVDRRR